VQAQRPEGIKSRRRVKVRSPRGIIALIVHGEAIGNREKTRRILARTQKSQQPFTGPYRECGADENKSGSAAPFWYNRSGTRGGKSIRERFPPNQRGTSADEQWRWSASEAKEHLRWEIRSGRHLFWDF
jgi:hypothetical protein